MENKKIIFLAHVLEKGGGEKALSEMSFNFPSSLQKVIVLFEKKISYPYKGKLISLDTPLSNKFPIKFWYLFLAFLRFKKIISEEKPDYVISSGHAPNIINLLTNKKAIVKVENFLSEHYNHFNGRIYKILVKLFFNKAKKIVVCSKAIEEDFVKSFGIKKEKIQVIYTPINIKRVQELSREPLEQKYQEIFKYPVIINMGRFSEQKGQWYLIRAFGEVKKRKKDLKLVILGEGELRGYLEQLIKDLNLEKDVFLLGWQENPFKFLVKSKLFVLSSLWEGMPTVILEAMACGVPVVSSDCKSGPREILAPGSNIDYQTKEVEYTPYGILVPVGGQKFSKAADPLTENEKLLSEAIIKILTDKTPSENLIKKSKQRVEEFDIKNIVKQWSDIWERC